jgi:hypothetical protein
MAADRRANAFPTRLAAAASLAFAAALGAPSADAIQLIAVGSLTSTTDLSGLTGSLENGNAANVLGGIGSGLAYAGGDTFLALPDRGPNAAVWNAAVDNTTSYVSRFQTVTMGLTASSSGSLPYSLTPVLSATTLLYSTTSLNYGSAPVPTINTGSQFYFTGRSDAFGTGSSLAATDARLDPESARVSNDGKSVFISDEYGPYVYQFDRATGARVNTFTLPAEFGVANKFAVGTNTAYANEGGTNTTNTSGRVANKGMEGLAISPDGKTLIGFMQSPLIQDGGDGGQYNRIIKIDIATGVTHQYVYDNKIGTDPTTGATLNKTYNSSEIIAINDHEFLVLERDGKGLGDGSNAVVKKVYKIDLSGASELPAGTSGATNLATYAVGKTQFLDLRSALTASVASGGLGLTDAQIPAKLEGLAFGQDVVISGVTKHTLYVANDNDFIPGTAGPNNFYVFAFDSTDLPNYVAQDISAVPLPAAGWLLVSGLGALGAAARRRRAAVIAGA